MPIWSVAETTIASTSEGAAAVALASNSRKVAGKSRIRFHQVVTSIKASISLFFSYILKKLEIAIFKYVPKPVLDQLTKLVLRVMALNSKFKHGSLKQL